MNAKDPAFLASLAVFGAIPADELSRIAAKLEVRSFDKAGELFPEGAAAREMFIVREGEIEVAKKNNLGADIRVATLRAGDVVGEMSLIDVQPRSATVRAIGPATLLVLSYANLSEIAHTSPKAWTLLVMNIAREISRRLRRADELLVKLDEPVNVEDLWRNWKPEAV